MPRNPSYHYLMTRYFRDHTKADQVRREYATLVAAGDDHAIAEAKMYGPLDGSLWFEVLKVGKHDSQVLFSSKDKS